MSLASEKRKLRETMLQKRRAVPHALSARAGDSVARHFADHPILAFAPSFAGYIAMRGELDVLPVFDIMAKYNKRTALPRIEQNTLQFHCWIKRDPLRRHPDFGSSEPLPSADTITPAIILVPLLAFDGDGNRLGYGGGFYDRTMQQLRSLPNAPLFIGAAYSIQELPHVPTDENDEQLDGIITEHGVSMF